MLKMQQLFAECGQKFNQTNNYQDIALSRQFKITKGEQYKQLPYMVLDYPQIKGANFDFVLRIMFWWGHYISCNLIIRTERLKAEQDFQAILRLKKTRILTGNNLWEQDLDSEEYTKLNKLSEEMLKDSIQTNTYLKLSRKIPLNKYSRLPVLTDEIYSEWITALSIKKGAD